MNELAHNVQMIDIRTTATFRVAVNDAGKKNVSQWVELLTMKLATKFVWQHKWHRDRWHTEVDTMWEDIGSHADAHHKTSMMKAALDNKKR